MLLAQRFPCSTRQTKHDRPLKVRMHLLSGRLSRFGQDDSDNYDRALQQMTPPVQPTLSSWTGPRPEGVPSVSTPIHSATVKHGRWEQAGLVMPAVSVEAVLRCMHQGQCCQYPRCPETKLMHCQGGAWAVRCIVSEEDLKQKLTAKLWHSWIYGSAPPCCNGHAHTQRPQLHEFYAEQCLQPQS